MKPARTMNCAISWVIGEHFSNDALEAIRSDTLKARNT